MKKFLCIFLAGLILSCHSAQLSKIKTDPADADIYKSEETEGGFSGFQTDVSFPPEKEKYDPSILPKIQKKSVKINTLKFISEMR